MDVGDIIAARYRVEWHASQGGMGAVYRGSDMETGDKVAIKVVHPGMDLTTTKRFLREADVLAALRQPGIVTHHAHGIADSGEPYLVMEWIEGETLYERLRHHPLTLAETIQLGIRVCMAMNSAHRAGVIHRDIKPANLLLPSGLAHEVKVADFGLVRMTGVDNSLTAPGEALGTPSFMAPEQARGFVDLDQRADIYSIGAVLFNCLTQRPPYIGAHSTAILAKVLFDDVPRVSQFRQHVPEQLDDLIHRLLAKDRDVRPLDAGQIAQQLVSMLHILADEPARSRQRTDSAITAVEQRFVAVMVVTGDSAAGPEGHSSSLATYAQRYGARLAGLANGTIAGVFDDEGNIENLAIRAAECALAIRRELGMESVALATGRSVVDGRQLTGAAIDRAVALLIGDSDTIATGVKGSWDDLDTPPEMIARLTDSGVTVDSVTAGLLERRFSVERDDNGTYHLNGNRLRIRTLSGLAARSTDCVGRRRELAWLESAMADCLDNESPQMNLIVAPPGGGKTRLCHEFIRRVEGGTDPVSIWTARGDWLRSRGSLSLLSQLIRNAIGLIEGQDDSHQRELLMTRVAEVVGRDDVARVAVFLGQLAGVIYPAEGRVQLEAARADPQLMHAQMRRAFTNWISAELRYRPALIVLEDIHWSDLSSIRFLESTLKSVDQGAIMVLATSRPDPEYSLPSMFRGIPVDVTNLRPLSRSHCETLARQLLDVADEAIIERAVERCEGNPYFLEELLRHMAAHGGDDVPETVLAVAESRLRELPAELRRILRAASVLGRRFWRGGVAALLGDAITGEELEGALQQLMDHDLVVEKMPSRFSGQEEFVFRHDLTREAAYGSLTGDDRERGHMRAGTWLDEVGESEAIVLAEHYRLGGAFGAAIAWYRRAAKQSLEANETGYVMENVQRAIACGASGQMRGELELLTAEVCNWTNKPEDAAEHSRAALELLEEGSSQWANAIHQLGWAATTIGAFDTLEEWVPSLIRHARTTSDDSYVISMTHCATHLAIGGKYDTARAIGEVIDGWCLDAEVSLPVNAAVTHMHSFLAYLSGELDRACDLMIDAADTWNELANERSYLLDLGNAGSVQLELGEYEKAARTLEVTVDRAQRSGLDHLVPTNQAGRALAIARSGRADEAEELCQAILALHPGSRHESITRTYLAQILLASERAEEALLQTQEALPLTASAVGQKAFTLGVKAQALLHLGRESEALEAAAEGMALFEELGALECGEGVLRLVHAEALHAVGKMQDASEAIRAAERRIKARARCIADAGRRASFLEQIPEHARTLHLARSW